MTERIIFEKLRQSAGGQVTVITTFYVEDIDGNPNGLLVTEEPYDLAAQPPWPYPTEDDPS